LSSCCFAFSLNFSFFSGKIVPYQGNAGGFFFDQNLGFAFFALNLNNGIANVAFEKQFVAILAPIFF